MMGGLLHSGLWEAQLAKVVRFRTGNSNRRTSDRRQSLLQQGRRLPDAVADQGVQTPEWDISLFYLSLDNGLSSVI